MIVGRPGVIGESGCIACVNGLTRYSGGRHSGYHHTVGDGYVVRCLDTTQYVKILVSSK